MRNLDHTASVGLALKVGRLLRHTDISDRYEA